MKALLILLPLFALVGVLALVVKVLETKRGGARARDASADDRGEERHDGPLPYRRGERPILSAAEREFLAVLEQAVAQISGGRGRVLVQVPLSRLIEARAGDASERQRWHNRIDRKSVDFVVVDSGFKARVAVELDDSSHGRQSRAERDRFVERACADAGMPLVRFATRAVYEVGAVVRELERAVGASEPVKAPS